jgi:hypothetical protein
MTAAIKRAAAFRVAKVRRVDALVSQGRTLAEALRTVELAETTYERWRAEIGSRGRAASGPHLSKSSTSIEARTAGAKTVAAGAGSDLHKDLTLEVPVRGAEAQTVSCKPFASEAKAPIAAVSDASALDDTTPVQSGQGADRIDVALATPSAETSQARFAVGSDRSRLKSWRKFAVGLLLAGAPVLSLSAIAFVDPARTTTTEEALERGGERLQGVADPVPPLEQKVADAEAAIGRLAQAGKVSQSKVDQLQQQAAGTLAELANLKTEVVAALSKARLPLVAQIDRQQADLLVQIEALRNKAASDGAQMEKLQKGVAALSQAQAPLAAELEAELEEQRRYFVALTDQLRQEAIGDRTDLARLKDQVKSSSEFLPAAAKALSGQQTDLFDDVAKLRQEVLASRASLSVLESELDDIKRAASAQAQPKAETESIGPPGESSTPAIDSLESGLKTSPTATVPASPPIVTPLATTRGVENMPNRQALVAPEPKKVGIKATVKKRATKRKLSTVPASPPIVTPLAATRRVEKVATKPAVKELATKPRVNRRFELRRRIPISFDQTGKNFIDHRNFFLDQAEEMSIEQQPAPTPDQRLPFVADSGGDVSGGGE